MLRGSDQSGGVQSFLRLRPEPVFADGYVEEVDALPRRLQRRREDSLLERTAVYLPFQRVQYLLVTTVQLPPILFL